ncbi:hypothetical protein YSA_00580 [Pseudomonas putida ND6]|uniref:Uncharacterized protein n=1 Tax=Pseudomonas putida ND6 TaxID=231023 RepID=I3UNL7_PSEPU|nr:hypothetical protein YSA_00580 [Pseudomonas putida ND6]
MPERIDRQTFAKGYRGCFIDSAYRIEDEAIGRLMLSQSFARSGG